MHALHITAAGHQQLAAQHMWPAHSILADHDLSTSESLMRAVMLHTALCIGQQARCMHAEHQWAPFGVRCCRRGPYMHHIKSTARCAGTMYTGCISFTVQLPGRPACLPERRSLEVPCMSTQTQHPLPLWSNFLDSLCKVACGCLSCTCLSCRQLLCHLLRSHTLVE